MTAQNRHGRGAPSTWGVRQAARTTGHPERWGLPSLADAGVQGLQEGPAPFTLRPAAAPHCPKPRAPLPAPQPVPACPVCQSRLFLLRRGHLVCLWGEGGWYRNHSLSRKQVSQSPPRVSLLRPNPHPSPCPGWAETGLTGPCAVHRRTGPLSAPLSGAQRAAWAPRPVCHRSGLRAGGRVGTGGAGGSPGLGSLAWEAGSVPGLLRWETLPGKEKLVTGSSPALCKAGAWPRVIAGFGKPAHVPRHTPSKPSINPAEVFCKPKTAS